MTLGCADEYTAYITARGSDTSVISLSPTAIEWHRKNNEVSTASVVVDGVSGDCCGDMADIDPWVHELHVIRDGVRVWCGPVLTVEYESDKVTVNASDLGIWLSRRRVNSKFDRQSILPEQWARKMVEECIEKDNSMNMSYSVWSASVGSGFDRMIRFRDFKMCDSEISEVASDRIDWWVILRVVYLAGYEYVTPEASVTDSHFASVGAITVSGEQTGNDYIVTGRGRGSSGKEKYGWSGDAELYGDPFPNQSIYGVHQRVVDNEYLHKTEQLYDKSKELVSRYNRLSTSFSGGAVDPSFPLDIMSIHPGVVLSVDLAETCRPITGNFRVNSLDVTVSEDGDEEVSVEVQRLGYG